MSNSWKKFFTAKASSLYYDSGIGADVSQVTSSNLTTSAISSPNNYTNSNEIVVVAAAANGEGGVNNSNNNNNTPTTRLRSLKNSAQMSSVVNLKSARDFFAPNKTENLFSLNSLNTAVAAAAAAAASNPNGTRKFQSGTLNVNILRKLNSSAATSIVNAASNASTTATSVAKNNETGMYKEYYKESILS